MSSEVTSIVEAANGLVQAAQCVSSVCFALKMFLEGGQ